MVQPSISGGRDGLPGARRGNGCPACFDDEGKVSMATVDYATEFDDDFDDHDDELVDKPD